MSALEVKRVWRHSPYENGVLMTHLCLAEHANEDGCFWPSSDRLSVLTRLSIRQVNRALKTLAEDGHLHLPKDRSQQNPMRLLWDADVLALDTGVQGDWTPTSFRARVSDEVEQSVGTITETAQESLLPDPVTEVWDLHVKLTGKTRSKLDGKKRRIITNAIKATDVERVKLAIRGHASSSFHRERGMTDLSYALAARGDRTIEGTIEMMASRVPANDSQRHTGMTVQELLAGYTGYNREAILGWMADVKRGEGSENSLDKQQAEIGERQLLLKAKIRVARDNGKVTYAKVTE